MGLQEYNTPCALQVGTFWKLHFITFSGWKISQGNNREDIFSPLLVKDLALSGLSFLLYSFLFWQAFKTFKSDRRFETSDGPDFQEENSKLYRRTFKGLSPSTTPLWKKKVLLKSLNQ